MKIKFHYSISFGGEVNINTRTNHLHFKKKTPWINFPSIPKEIKNEFYVKKVELNDEIKKLISNTFDKNDIWNWPKDYNEASGVGGVCDGDLWEINASFNDKKVSSSGASCYPDGYKKLISMFSKIFDVDFYQDI